MKHNTVWHPYTQEKLYDNPYKVLRGKGAKLYLEDGTCLIDAVSSWWVNLFGHGRPEIAEAIANQALQLEHVIFAGFTHEPAIELANLLLENTSAGFSKVFYSDNGSTAVEVAMKMALQYFQNKGESERIRIIALDGAYHGDTFGAMSVGERNSFNAPFNQLLFDVVHLPLPNENNIEKLLGSVEEMLMQNDVAAFIYEPLLQGTAGMRMYDASALDSLLNLFKKHGVMLIADEVMTGFGRTGKLFASDYMTCKPDLMCLSKGITGGFMPLGVTLASNEIYEAFYSDNRMKTFFHGHSYTGNPLSCAASVASFKLLLSDEIKSNMQFLSDALIKMRSELSMYENAADLRVLGHILAFELVTKEKDGYFNTLRDRLYKQSLNNGVLLRPLGNTLYTMPPYIINEEELKQVEDTFKLLLEKNA